MIKDMAWNMFKTTGNVDSYLEFKQIKNLESNINMQKVEANGNCKDKGVIIAESNMGDFDKMLTILTQEWEKLHVLLKVQGVKLVAY